MLLTRPEDGTQLDPVNRVEEYGSRHIAGNDPGPTISAAWEKWSARMAGQRSVSPESGPG